MHTAKPAGRTLAEFKPLNSGEAKLLEACRTGAICRLGDKCPGEASSENTVRASFVRFLALGGDERTPVHEHGIQLKGAWIAGKLDLEGARVIADLGLFHCQFSSLPVLRSTQIQGCLFLCGSHMPGLKADRLVCNGGIFLNEKFSATGTVRLQGAQIGGNLSCGSATLDGKEGDALAADGAVINGSVFLNKEFSATGTVRLLGAQIGGELSCASAMLDGKKGVALSADRAVIKGDAFLNEKFSATGEVRLLGAQIGGSLSCGSATLDGKEGDALSADRAVINGSVFLNKEFSATGKVRLLGAQIGGNLECSSATLDGKEGDALSADRAVINGSVFLNKKFSATGKVHLLSAQIGGNLECGSATLDGKKGNALSCDGMTVSGSFFFHDMLSPVNGISFNHAHVGRLVDDENSWGERLILDGFTYDSFAGGAPTAAAARLAWLDKQRAGHAGLNDTGDNFRPQPWRQLQKVLREMGHMEDAHRVAIAFEDRLRKAGLIGKTSAPEWHPRAWLVSPIKEAFHWLFGKLIGYGYRPLLLAGWMLTVWLACAGFYWYAAMQGVFAPSNPLVFQHQDYLACIPGSVEAKAEIAKPASAHPVQGAGNWYLCEKLREEYTGFSPLAYSMDVILPLVDLQQDQDWAPMIPTPSANWDIEIIAWSLKHVTRLVVWIEILFGWIASLLLVAVVSGLTKRHED